MFHFIFTASQFLFAEALYGRPQNEDAFDQKHLAYGLLFAMVSAFGVFASFISKFSKSVSLERPAPAPIKGDSDSPASRFRATVNYNRFQEFAEYSDCMKKLNVKDLDPMWITFKDNTLEDRFVRLTSQRTATHLLLPLTVIVLNALSELFFDRQWNFNPSIHLWQHEAAVVLNLSSALVIASCALIHRFFYDPDNQRKESAIYETEKVLVASAAWLMSLVLFFGTRDRVCKLFKVTEREVFGSTYDIASNDEVCILLTLTFSLVLFSIYVPMRFCYLVHLFLHMAVCYPASLWIRGITTSTSNIWAFYGIIGATFLGQRYIETQRRGAFQAILHSLDARMDQELEEEVDKEIAGTALERLLANLRFVDRVLTRIENHNHAHSLNQTDQMQQSRALLKESRDILSHTDGLFSLNVDTMFKDKEKFSDLDDRVDFKRYLKIEFGQAGGRKIFDGIMSERKAEALLASWAKRNTAPRMSLRRSTTVPTGIGNGIMCFPETPKASRCGLRGDSIDEDREPRSRSVIEVKAPEHLCTKLDLSEVGKNWNFNTFQLAARTNNRTLIFVGEATVVPLAEEVFSCVEAQEMMRLFVRRLWSHYLTDNAYHNENHGATVCHMATWLFNNSGLAELSNPPERMGLQVAALGHDCGHFGRNNLFCQNSGHSVAYLYNDYAVMESMHAAITIRLLATGDLDYRALLDTLSLEQRRAFKSTVIGLIMETDMKKHFEAVSKFRSKVKGDDWSLKQPACRASLCKMIMKASDVGQSSVSWELHMEWSMRVLAEFFEQGDEEQVLKLPISPLCDRANYDLCSSQKFFTDVLCRPLFEEIKNAVETVRYHEGLEKLLQEMTNNIEHWSTFTKEVPWDPKTHSWPPTSLWDDWRKHTPTGRAMLELGEDHLTHEHMPYPHSGALEQLHSVENHLEVISQYNPHARGEGFEPSKRKVSHLRSPRSSLMKSLRLERQEPQCRVSRSSFSRQSFVSDAVPSSRLTGGESPIRVSMVRSRSSSACMRDTVNMYDTDVPMYHDDDRLTASPGSRQRSLHLFDTPGTPMGLNIGSMLPSAPEDAVVNSSELSEKDPSTTHTSINAFKNPSPSASASPSASSGFFFTHPESEAHDPKEEQRQQQESESPEWRNYRNEDWLDDAGIADDDIISAAAAAAAAEYDDDFIADDGVSHRRGRESTRDSPQRGIRIDREKIPTPTGMRSALKPTGMRPGAPHGAHKYPPGQKQVRMQERNSNNLE